MMIKLLSHLVHVEIAATDLEESTRFYTEQVGLRIFAREGGKVYLRAWGDHYTYSVVLSAADQPQMIEMAWRTSSEEAVDEAARVIEAAGITGEWSDSGFGHGRAYTFTGPYGHRMKVCWEVERYRAAPEFASIYPDRPERRSRHAVSPRQLDHITLASSDVHGFSQWYCSVLGFRHMARTQVGDAPIDVFSVLTTNEKSHDLGVLLDRSSTPGRINHYAFWVDTHEDLLQAADVLMENGVRIEYGPSVHGIGEQTFLYFRDPSGMRIEVNTGGYRNYVPDWEPNIWHPSQGSSNFYRNGPIPMSMTESFPPADGPTATEEGIHPGTEARFVGPGAGVGRH